MVLFFKQEEKNRGVILLFKQPDTRSAANPSIVGFANIFDRCLLSCLDLQL